MENTTNNTMNFADMMAADENLQPLNQLMTSIKSMPDETLNESSVDVLMGMIKGSFTEKRYEY